MSDELAPTVWLPYKITGATEDGVTVEGHAGDLMTLPPIPTAVLNHPSNRVYFCPLCDPPWQNEPYCRC